MMPRVESPAARRHLADRCQLSPVPGEARRGRWRRIATAEVAPGSTIGPGPDLRGTGQPPARLRQETGMTSACLRSTRVRWIAWAPNSQGRFRSAVLRGGRAPRPHPPSACAEGGGAGASDRSSSPDPVAGLQCGEPNGGRFANSRGSGERRPASRHHDERP